MSQSGEISPETAADAPANHNNESITTCSTRPSHVPFERNATRTTHQTADVGFNDITQYGGSRSMRPQPSLWMKRETGGGGANAGGKCSRGKGGDRSTRETHAVSEWKGLWGTNGNTEFYSIQQEYSSKQPPAAPSPCASVVFDHNIRTQRRRRHWVRGRPSDKSGSQQTANSCLGITRADGAATCSAQSRHCASHRRLLAETRTRESRG